MASFHQICVDFELKRTFVSNFPKFQHGKFKEERQRQQPREPYERYWGIAVRRTDGSWWRWRRTGCCRGWRTGQGEYMLKSCWTCVNRTYFTVTVIILDTGKPGKRPIFIGVDRKHSEYCTVLCLVRERYVFSILCNWILGCGCHLQRRVGWGGRGRQLFVGSLVGRGRPTGRCGSLGEFLWLLFLTL